VGDTLKYRGKVQGEGTITFLEQERQPVKIQGEFTLTQKVVEVKEDGAATITTTVEGGSVAFATPAVSQTMPVSLPVLTQVISPDGRLLSSKGWERGGAEPARTHINLRRVIERIQLFEFPDHPVAAGDSWEQAPPPPPAAEKPPAATGSEAPQAAAPQAPAGAPGLTWKLMLAGWERVGQRDCAQIRATADSPIKDVLPPDRLGDIMELSGTEKLETVTDFAPTAGRVVRQVASAHSTLHTLTTHASGGQPVAGDTDITAKVTLELR
jgi:hypothetical protein